MSGRELVIVAAKVFALYVLLKALVLVPSFFPVLLTVMDHDDSAAVWAALVSLVSLGVLVAIGVGMWRLSSSLAAKLIESPERDTEASFDLGSFERVTLSILGLYITINALVWIAMTTGNAASAQRFGAGESFLNLQLGISLVVRFLELAVGVSLIVGSRGWAKVLRRLRTFGTDV